MTFVTYNVLADALSGNEAGFSSETEDLAFENRAGKLLKKIFPREDEEETNVESDSTSNPDVICLQECDHYYDFFEPEMQKRGYFGTYREDKWSPCQKFSNELKDGLALFCKRETVELVGMHISTTAETKARQRRDDARRRRTNTGFETKSACWLTLIWKPFSFAEISGKTQTPPECL